MQGTIVRDQHGRKYSAVIEKETQCFTGQLIPLFRAPVMPPPTRIQPTSELGMVYINYDAWLTETRTHRTHYREALRAIADSKYADKAGEAMENPTPQMLMMAGPAPMSDKPILACKAENRWVLGLSDVVPTGAWVKEILEMNQPRETNEFAFLEDSLDEFADEAEVEEEAEEEGTVPTVGEAPRKRGRPRRLA